MPHTPGPWTFDRMLNPPNAKDRRCGFVVNGPDTDHDDLPTRVCDLRAPRGVDGFSEAESNARLIAAAPELLEAMEKAALSIMMASKYFAEDTDLQIVGHIGDASETLHNAIAKAKGQ